MKAQNFYTQDHSALLPREKLQRDGSEFLSDFELMSLLIGSGIKGKSVFEISKEIVAIIDQNHGLITISDLKNIRGLGPNKAMTVIAALEIAYRTGCFIPWKISSPKDVVPLLTHYADRQQEHFILLCLNGAHCVVKKHVVSVGVINKTLVHPREVFSVALEHRAAACIVAHNHPSGIVKPSEEDIQVTNILNKAGKIMEIPLLDHIIFSMYNHFSFVENKLLTS